MTGRKKSPLSPLAHINLGGENEARGLVDRAEAEYLTALNVPRFSEKDPSILLALRNLGALHIREEKYDLALRELEEAVQLYPNFADTHRFLGALYLKVYNDREKGVFHLKRSLELAPDQAGTDVLRILLEKGP